MNLLRIQFFPLPTLVRNKHFMFSSFHLKLLGLYSTGNVMVGPLSVRDGRPLPPELEKFVSNSGGHGFIIVSFGSNVASILSRKVVDMLAVAFGKLKQKVVWRLKGISVIYKIKQSVGNSISRLCLLSPGKTVNQSVLDRQPVCSLVDF